MGIHDLVKLPNWPFARILNCAGFSSYHRQRLNLPPQSVSSGSQVKEMNKTCITCPEDLGGKGLLISCLFEGVEGHVM